MCNAAEYGGSWCDNAEVTITVVDMGPQTPDLLWYLTRAECNTMMNMLRCTPGYGRGGAGEWVLMPVMLNTIPNKEALMLRYDQYVAEQEAAKEAARAKAAAKAAIAATKRAAKEAAQVEQRRNEYERLRAEFESKAE